MRSLIPSIAAAVALLSAPAAFAAPTCQDQDGATIRCGTPGAMPVGWTLPDDQRPAPDGPPLEELLALACVIGGLFALIALMPEFDGRRDQDWGEQEGDDERR